MKVSVLMTTYNQEAFVTQAIESILKQDVQFDYEVVIGEDASTDRTREIVLEFQRKNPDKVKVYMRDSVDAERDRAAGVGGKGSFINSLRACRGQYVALLDGDDYWTDVYKLRKQVDFLDSHPDYVMSFHNAGMLREGHEPVGETFNSPDQKETATIEDLLAGNFIFAGSTLFRHRLFGELPDWFNTLKTGDWALPILNAQFGKIGYLNEVMAAYRIHYESWWSSKSPQPQLLDQIHLLDSVNAHLGFKYDRQIKGTQSRAYAGLAEIAYQEGDLPRSRTLLSKSLKLGLANHCLPSLRQFGRWLK